MDEIGKAIIWFEQWKRDNPDDFLEWAFAHWYLF